MVFTDVLTAVRNNAREIRAVTPTYTFSIKRPKGGWGISEAQLKRDFDTADASTRRTSMRYISARGNNRQQSLDRANAVYYHSIWKDLSKRYGWNYSKKKG